MKTPDRFQSKARQMDGRIMMEQSVKAHRAALQRKNNRLEKINQQVSFLTSCKSDPGFVNDWNVH